MNIILQELSFYKAARYLKSSFPALLIGFALVFPLMLSVFAEGRPLETVTSAVMVDFAFSALFARVIYLAVRIFRDSASRALLKWSRRINLLAVFAVLPLFLAFQYDAFDYITRLSFFAYDQIYYHSILYLVICGIGSVLFALPYTVFSLVFFYRQWRLKDLKSADTRSYALTFGIFMLLVLFFFLFLGAQ